MRLTFQDMKSLRPRELSGKEDVAMREQRRDAGLSQGQVERGGAQMAVEV